MALTRGGNSDLGKKKKEKERRKKRTDVEVRRRHVRSLEKYVHACALLGVCVRKHLDCAPRVFTCRSRVRTGSTRTDTLALLTARNTERC